MSERGRRKPDDGKHSCEQGEAMKERILDAKSHDIPLSYRQHLLLSQAIPSGECPIDSIRDRDVARCGSSCIESA